MTIVIRPARAEDAAVLEEILQDTFNSTWRPQLTPEAVEKQLREKRPAAFVRARGMQFMVAEIGGDVVGLVDWEGDFINALHVRGSHARKGAGAALMDYAERAIADAGFKAVRLETDTFNANSQTFYAARGYVEADRYPDLEWDSGLTTLLLVKAL